MPKYKLILTVQDSFGMTKEIEAGIVEAAGYELTEDELNNVVERLPLDNYVQKTELPEELATDAELEEAVRPTVKYGGFKFREASE
jgi:hypothetical protein